MYFTVVRSSTWHHTTSPTTEKRATIHIYIHINMILEVLILQYDSIVSYDTLFQDKGEINMNRNSFSDKAFVFAERTIDTHTNTHTGRNNTTIKSGSGRVGRVGAQQPQQLELAAQPTALSHSARSRRRPSRRMFSGLAFASAIEARQSFVLRRADTIQMRCAMFRPPPPPPFPEHALQAVFAPPLTLHRTTSHVTLSHCRLWQLLGRVLALQILLALICPYSRKI